MKATLTDALKKLRLSGLLQTLEVRVHEAKSGRLDYDEFLELILQDELAIRHDRQIARRTKAACFRDQKSLEDFDWDFNRSINRKQIYDLAAGKFLKEGRGILFSGPPGTGKSHLAQAIGHHLIRSGHTVLYRSIFDTVRDFLHDEAFDGHEKVMARYLKPDVLIIDDMGMKSLPKRSGEYLFEIIMRRHEVCPTIMTTNRRLGQADRRYPVRHRDPRPVPARRRDHHHHRQKLPPQRPCHQKETGCDLEDVALSKKPPLRLDKRARPYRLLRRIAPIRFAQR